jgi:hypothetical protein
VNPNSFWPFAESVICVRCLQPVRTLEAVAVVDAGVLSGMAHEECPT